MAQIRINKVLRELNISLDRAVDFLESKGIDIEKSPNTKISQEVYDTLADEFQTDATKREKAQEVSEAKLKEKEKLREQREREIEEKQKKEPKQETVVKAKAELSGPKKVGKIELDKPKAKPKEESKPEEERRGEIDMKRTQDKQPSIDEVRKETLAYVSGVRELCSKHGLSSEFETRMIKEGKTMENVRQEILNELASKTEAQQVRGQNATVTAGDYEERDIVREGVTNAILHRYKSGKYELNDKGRMFRGDSLLDMARRCLEAVNVRTAGMSRNQIVDHAFQTRSAGYHSSSDFPLILEDIVNKTLRAGYREAPQTFQPFTRMVTVADFKQISRTQLGDAPELLEIPESGEYKDGTIGEGAEKYNVKDYGRMVSVTRKTIVNDDLEAFTRIPEMYGRRARTLESNLAWGQITDNANMFDGNPLFSAAHNNLTTPGTAISVDSIGLLRSRMRRQLSLGGDFISVDGSYLVAPAALETKAAQFIAQISPDQAGNVNPFAGNLQLIVEPRLDDDSTTAWYVFSSADEIDIIEMAKLTGEEEPMIASRDGWRVDGVELKVRHAVGVKAIDWRGVQKNLGA